MPSLPLPPAIIALIALAASVSALMAAFIAEYGFDLQPCVLCLYQRWPYAAAGLLAALTMLVGRSMPGVFRIALPLLVLAFVVDAGIAGFHVGVEQGWWTGTEACVGPTSKALTLEDLRAQIMATPVVRCDEPAFTFLGISMAGYNLIYALGVAALVGFGALGLWKGKPQA